MNSINVLKKWVVDSQIYVSLMGTFLALFFMLEQHALRFPTIVLVFLTYFSGYLYTKYQNNSRIFYRVLIINALCGISCAILIIVNHNSYRLFRWLVIVLLGLLYDSFFLKYFIRKIPLLKVFYVGLTWALMHAWLIFPEFNASIFWINLLFITALVLPFDIRDMKSDEVITFPKLIGVQNTKYLAYVFTFISLILAILYLSLSFAIAYFLTSCVTFVLIYFSENWRPGTYFSVGIETCSGLPLLFLLLMEAFGGLG